MKRRLLLIAGLLASTPLAAQTPPEVPPAAPQAEEEIDPDLEEEEIVVTGQRLPGSVVGDIEPELTLSPADIRALGANSVAEILEAIAPQTSSGRGRGGGGGPVVLLNGRRISGFGEIRDLPSEAIARAEVLPEEVALKYGYRADQRVVNIVLRRRFNAVTAEIEPNLATGGGRAGGEVELGYLSISGPTRLSINGEYEHQSPLTEAERNIALSPTAPFDTRPFRTLLAETDRFSLNGTASTSLVDTVSATLNARVEGTDSESRFGALGTADAPVPLTRDSVSRTQHLGLALNGDIAPWRWSLTANADRTRDSSATDNAATPGTRDTSRAVNRSLGAELVANGPLFSLPAGDVSTALRSGFEFRGFDSESLRQGIVRTTSLGRDTANAQANIDVPIASRRNGTLAAIGDLSLNANLAYDELSDFGGLTTYGYGAVWSPIKELDLIASVTHEDGAPSVRQIGDPVIATPNVRVFDLVRGETVDITRIEGGNAGLLADDRRVFKLGATLKPLSETDLTLRVDYTNQRVSNAIASFPSLTPAIEAAFPERVVRDASGRLVSVDARPINFARTKSESVRWGINFAKAIGPEPSPEELQKMRDQFRALRPAGGGDGPRGGRRTGADGPGDGPGGGGGRGGGRGFGGRGGGFGGPGNFLRTRLTVGLYHTWRLEESVLIRPDLPELDLLDGGAIGARGGQPRHEVEAQLGLTKRGLGARLTANWQSATTLDADPFGNPSPNDLRFGSLTTLNLRLFADLGANPAWVAKAPWLRGFRVRFGVDNIFDAKPDVRDRTGLTPIGYQPDLLDPLGRTISLSIRKQFR